MSSIKSASDNFTKTLNALGMRFKCWNLKFPKLIWGRGGLKKKTTKSWSPMLDCVQKPPYDIWIFSVQNRSLWTLSTRMGFSNFNKLSLYKNGRPQGEINPWSWVERTSERFSNATTSWLDFASYVSTNRFVDTVNYDCGKNDSTSLIEFSFKTNSSGI